MIQEDRLPLHERHRNFRSLCTLKGGTTFEYPDVYESLDETDTVGCRNGTVKKPRSAPMGPRKVPWKDSGILRRNLEPYWERPSGTCIQIPVRNRRTHPYSHPSRLPDTAPRPIPKPRVDHPLSDPSTLDDPGTMWDGDPTSSLSSPPVSSIVSLARSEESDRNRTRRDGRRTREETVVIMT